MSAAPAPATPVGRARATETATYVMQLDRVGVPLHRAERAMPTLAAHSAFAGLPTPAAPAATASKAERICATPRLTGLARDGGYARRAVADARYCLSPPDRFSDAEAAPLLWGERVLRSVANLTRAHGRDFFAAIADMPLRIEAAPYKPADADEALARLREGRLVGAAVLVP